MIKKIFLFSLLVKIVFIFTFPVQLDEMVYYAWSRHLDFSYFDHPPFIAFLLWPTQILKQLSPSLIRLPGLILSHGYVLIWLKIARDFFPKVNLSLMAGLLLFSPMTGWGQLVMTPDVPLLFFTTVSFYYFLMALNKPSVMNYSLFGLFLGVGFLSKYTIVLLPLGILIYLALSGSWRQVKLNYLFFTFLVGLLTTIPVFIWNIQHDWASFNFQMTHGLNGNQNQISVKKYVLEQLGLLSPFLFFILFRFKSHSKILLTLAWTPLMFFLISSFRARAEANWPLMAYPFAYLCIAEEANWNWKLIKLNFLVWGAAILTVILSIGLHLDLLKKTKVFEAKKFMDYTRFLDKQSPLFATTAQMASAISFQSNQNIYKLRESARIDSYDFFIGSMPPKHFYFINSIGSSLPEWLVKEGANSTRLFVIDDDYEMLEVTRR